MNEEPSTKTCLCAALAFFLCCAPAAADSKAGASSAAVEKLAVALVYPPSTAEARQFLGADKTPHEPTEHDREAFKGVLEVFRNKFSGVMTVGSLEEAGKTGADLVGYVDINSTVPRTVFGKATFDIHASLVTLDGKPVYSLSVQGSQRGRPPLLPNDIRQKAVERACASLLKSLDGSKRLSQAAEHIVRERKARPNAPAGGPAASAPEEFDSDVDKAVYSFKENPDNFALIVGIDEYSDIPAARFAGRDAAAVREHLLALGYPERNIVFLAGPRASRAGLVKNLESWLPRNVNKDSTVFFYYSGHGAPDTKTGQSYLLPWDGDPRFLEDTAYSTKRLYAKLNELKVRQVFAALDACFSGAGGRSILPQGARPLVMTVDAGNAAMGNLIVFAAAGADEITGSEESQGHGLFTYYFLKGLAGAAGDPAGDATVQGLQDYLLPKVRDAARRENRDQTPALYGASDARGKLRLR